jgi:hypothetical protein
MEIKKKKKKKGSLPRTRVFDGVLISTWMTQKAIENFGRPAFLCFFLDKTQVRSRDL